MPILKRQDIYDKIDSQPSSMWTQQEIRDVQDSMDEIGFAQDKEHQYYEQDQQAKWMFEAIQTINKNQMQRVQEHSNFLQARRVQQLEAELGLDVGLDKDLGQDLTQDISYREERVLSSDADIAMRLMEEQRARQVQEEEQRILNLPPEQQIEALMEQGLTQEQAKEMVQDIKEQPRVRSKSVTGALTTQQHEERKEIEAEAKKEIKKAQEAKVEAPKEKTELEAERPKEDTPKKLR